LQWPGKEEEGKKKKKGMRTRVYMTIYTIAATERKINAIPAETRTLLHSFLLPTRLSFQF